MIYILEYLDFQDFWLLFYSLLSLAFIIIIPRILGVSWLNALFVAQLTLIVNSIAIIGGYRMGMIDEFKLFHFYLTEYIFFIVAFFVYKILIIKNSYLIREKLDLYLNGRFAILILIISIVNFVFDYSMAPTDGGSRIKYMTNEWFSIIRPIIAFTTPIKFIAIIHLIFVSKRTILGIVILIFTIAGSAAAGSKAGFLFGLLFGVLFIKDVYKNSNINFSKYSIMIFITMISSATVRILLNLDQSLYDILNRVLLFAESTIIVYFSSDPSSACKEVSLIASLHRGFARFIGDASANNIETLFGYALTIQELGINTFTGPNARLGSYFACNFPEYKILVGLLPVIFYILLTILIFNLFKKKGVILLITSAFVVNSLIESSQDFNLLMAYITNYIMVLIVLIFFMLMKFSAKSMKITNLMANSTTSKSYL